jgi:hypothetical protein
MSRHAGRVRRRTGGHREEGVSAWHHSGDWRSIAMFRELVRESVQLEGERLATFLTASARRSFVKNTSSSLCPESRGASGAQFERVVLSTARASVPL